MKMTELFAFAHKCTEISKDVAGANHKFRVNFMEYNFDTMEEMKEFFNQYLDESLQEQIFSEDLRKTANCTYESVTGAIFKIV